MSMKSYTLRDLTPYSLVEIYKRSSETSVNFHQITRSYTLDDSAFHIHRRESRKSHIVIEYWDSNNTKREVVW
jgi:hypothetical protein